MDNLKPCPFCGGEAHVVTFLGKTRTVLYIECGGCKALMGNPRPIHDALRGKLYFENEDELVKAWNNRKEAEMLEKIYYFRCSLDEKYADYDQRDEWDCAELWLDSVRGVEYNFCIDHGVNSSAIYKLDYNESEMWHETDYSTFVHYEIDFNNPDWKDELKRAMYEAVVKFFEE